MSLFDFFPWWSWLIGAVGLGGLLALWLLAPAAAAILAELVGKLLRAILATRIGCAILAAAIAGTAADLHRRAAEQAVCEERIDDLREKAKAAAQKRDADIAAATERQFRPIIDDLQKQADDLQRQASEYETQLQGQKPAAQCQLGDGPLRLRKRK